MSGGWVGNWEDYAPGRKKDPARRQKKSTASKSYGWADDHARMSRLPGDWEKRRAAVLKRDGYQCTHIRRDTEARCVETATDVDHVERGDNHDLANLAAKCSWHHRQKTAREGGTASAEARARRPGRRRAEERHPGSLE